VEAVREDSHAAGRSTIAMMMMNAELWAVVVQCCRYHVLQCHSTQLPTTPSSQRPGVTHAAAPRLSQTAGITYALATDADSLSDSVTSGSVKRGVLSFKSSMYTDTFTTCRTTQPQLAAQSSTLLSSPTYTDAAAALTSLLPPAE